MKKQNLGKKGISPLIATVLLLAFAVAIGTMAVSYILDVARDECAGTTIVLEQKTQVCHNGERASFVLSNKGDAPISAVIVRFVTAAQQIDERKIALTLDAGSATRVDLEYKTPAPDGTQVIIVPFTMDEDKEHTCAEKEIRSALVTC